MGVAAPGSPVLRCSWSQQVRFGSRRRQEWLTGATKAGGHRAGWGIHTSQLRAVTKVDVAGTALPLVSAPPESGTWASGASPVLRPQAAHCSWRLRISPPSLPSILHSSFLLSFPPSSPLPSFPEAAALPGLSNSTAKQGPTMCFPPMSPGPFLGLAPSPRGCDLYLGCGEGCSLRTGGTWPSEMSSWCLEPSLCLSYGLFGSPGFLFSESLHMGQSGSWSFSPGGISGSGCSFPVLLLGKMRPRDRKELGLELSLPASSEAREHSWRKLAPPLGELSHLPVPTFLIFKQGRCDLPIGWKAVVVGRHGARVVAVRTE